jgi:hypothetical protein
MSNAESSSVPGLAAPRVLLRVEALPVERHPAAVYQSSLGSVPVEPCSSPSG